jgi:hypothetical protein
MFKNSVSKSFSQSPSFLPIRFSKKRKEGEEEPEEII